MPWDGTPTPRGVVGSRGTLSMHPVPARALPSSSEKTRQAPLRPTLTPSPAINTVLGLQGQTLSWHKTIHNGMIYTHQAPPLLPCTPGARASEGDGAAE